MKTVFVSSTFCDMHAERDAIHDITAPIVNEKAREYGDVVDFCDLRWGINTMDLDSESSNRKVLEVCLDTIDRSDPPMVVILGYRYGWIPEKELISNMAEHKQLELEDLERSVTALEIEYGALSTSEKAAHTLFYFREIEGIAPNIYQAEDALHAKKVAELKSRIRNIVGGKIKYYALKWTGQGFEGIADFAEMLAEDLLDMFCPEWKEKAALTPFEQERRIHENFIKERATCFQARKIDAEHLLQIINSQQVTIIKGPIGSGKTTLFCYLVDCLAKNNTVLPFVSGLTNGSNTTSDIIENTVYWLELKLGKEHFMETPEDLNSKKATQKKLSDWQERLAELCETYVETGETLIVMLDAADQLLPDKARDNLAFIPNNVNGKVRFVITCTQDFPENNYNSYLLEPISENDKRAVITGSLGVGRELSSSVIDKMLSLRESDNPLFLSLLVQRLQMMNHCDFEAIIADGGSMEAIESRQLILLKTECPDSLDKMSAALLREAGARINPILTQKVAELLAASRHGLRRYDLSLLLGSMWTELDFARFVSYMHNCFILRNDGCIDFTHKSIRAGFSDQKETLIPLQEQLLSHFLTLPDDDPIRVSESAWHAIQADNKLFFYNTVKQYSFFARQTNNYVNESARELVKQTILDGGKWVNSLIDSIMDQYNDFDFLYNVGDILSHTGFYPDINTIDNLINQNILPKIKVRLKSAGNGPELNALSSFLACYYKLGQMSLWSSCYYELGREVTLTPKIIFAIDCFQTAIAIFKNRSLIPELSNFYVGIFYIISAIYHKEINIYHRMGDIKNKITLARELVSLFMPLEELLLNSTEDKAEKSLYISVCNRFRENYSTAYYAMSDMDDSENYYKKALDYTLRLADNRISSADQLHLAHLYKHHYDYAKKHDRNAMENLQKARMIYLGLLIDNLNGKKTETYEGISYSADELIDIINELTASIYPDHNLLRRIKYSFNRVEIMFILFWKITNESAPLKERENKRTVLWLLVNEEAEDKNSPEYLFFSFLSLYDFT